MSPQALALWVVVAMLNDPAPTGNPSTPDGAAPRRRRPTGAVIVAVVAILLGLACAVWVWRPWVTARPLVEHFPAGALDDYVPANAGAVLDLNMKQIGAAPVVQQHIKASLDHLVKRSEDNHAWAAQVGIDPFKDLEWLRVFFVGGDTGNPLWVGKGRFDPARFQVGPNKLQPRVVDRFRVFESSSQGRTTTVAQAGDYLVACDSQAHVLDALNHAADGKKSEPADAALRDLLAAVDKKQSVWLAVSLTKLGRVPTLHSAAAETVLRPVFNHAQAAQGGFTFGDDLQAQFTLRARDEAAATELEQSLKSRTDVARDLAGGFKAANALGLFSGESDLLPVLRLVGAGEVSREGTTVRLRCRLPADQFGP
jgi:hypothetical protein